jgi:hypothetical protein
MEEIGKNCNKMRASTDKLVKLSLLKDSFFWNILRCSLVKVNRLFGRKYLLHLQCQRVNRAISDRQQAELNVHYFYLHGVLIDYEDGGDMFLLDVG